MKKIVTIGGATQDIFLHVTASDNLKFLRNLNKTSCFPFESGEKVEVEKISYFTGGGATNSATAFKRLGLDAHCYCLIGYDPAGRQVIDDLEHEGISTSLVIKSEIAPTGTSYIVSSPQFEQTIFAHRGANKLLPLQDFPRHELEGADYLYLTSLNYTCSESLEALLTEAKAKNISVAMNPGLSQITKTAEKLSLCLSLVDIFILNTSEAKSLMVALGGHDEKAPFDVHLFLNKIMPLGPKIIVVTNGTNGVHVATKEFILFHPSLPAQIVSTVGAGDAFGATFVASLALETDIADALRNGVINSASVVGTTGSKPGLLTRTEIEERRKSLDVNLLQKSAWK